MELQPIIEVVTGEAGAIALLLIMLFLFINGKVVPRGYIEDLKESNSTLMETLKEQSKSLDVISQTTVESLENSKITLRIIRETRSQTGIFGDEDEDTPPPTRKGRG